MAAQRLDPGFDPRELTGEKEVDEAEVQAQKALARRIAMLEEDGMKLASLEEADRTVEVCRAALIQNGLALQFVPEDMRDMYLCQKALRTTGLALQFVPDSLRSRPVCLLAVRHDGLALQFVPDELRSEAEVCRTAILQNSCALRYVPEALLNEEMCLYAVRVDGRALEFVPEELRTPELCFEACRTNGLALAWVPEHLLTDLLRVRALFSARECVLRTTKVVCLTPPDWEELSKMKPREEWGRFEKWSFEPPADFPCPADRMPAPEEVAAYLKGLADAFVAKSGMEDFAARAEALKEEKAGKGFWLDVSEHNEDGETARRISIYGPGLALLYEMHQDEHGVPDKAGAFAAAARLMDWTAGWTETQLCEPLTSAH